mgnify:CR=1 FL=1
MKLCGCVNEKTVDKVIETANSSEADMIEHRIDYMEQLHKLDNLYTTINKPVIATNRKADEGGHKLQDEKQRINTLIAAIRSGCKLVDIELSAEKKAVIEHAKKNNCRVIVSFHDFEMTPDEKTLKEIMLRQKESGDFGKIATTPKTIEDCHRVLNMVLEAKKIGFPMIAFCMGELGKFTRITSLLYGAPFMYASIKETNAPGQLNIKEMKDILEVLG